VGGFAGSGDVEGLAGDNLRQRLAASDVRTFPGHRVWSATHDGQGPDTGFRVDALGPEGNAAFRAPALVVATGAHERVVPFPGWTLPGVIGLAAATILLKSHGVSPGKRVVVAGCGPLLYSVAAGLVKAGAKILVVADMAHRGAWLQRLPSILGRPALAARGAGWAARTILAGVPLLSGHGMRRAEGNMDVRQVVLGPVDSDGAPTEGKERTFDADCLIVGHGLTTACEITRVLRAEHRHDPLRGGWVPVVNATFQTSIPGLYAIGDGAGIRGQQMATLMGKCVGLDLCRGIGSPLPERAQAEARLVKHQMTRGVFFSDAMAGLMAQRQAQVYAIAPDTVVCRCEDVTRGEIDAAIDCGAQEINQLKHFTRCGMGPCQGRYCGDTVEELMARKLGISRNSVGQWTGRPPLRPVALGELIGDFSYSDIPIPEPAPL
jgi:thioredoxin reductase/bacterioferritin-associated ferredoxin